MRKQWAVGAAVVVMSTGLVAGSAGASDSADEAAAAPASQARSIVAQQFTLRLASDAKQVANVRGAGTADGVPIIQYPWSGTTNERWELDSALGGYYRLKAVNSGKCLNVQGGGNANGAQVIQYTCGSSDNELWKFVPAGTGYQVVVKSSGKCLNVQGGVGSGRNLIQYDCVSGGAPNDVWLPVWEPNNL